MKILVLGGGDSPEREISLRSASNVFEAAEKVGYEVSSYDPADGVEGLIKLVGNVDLVLPMLHGEGGEDGTLQEVLEDYNVKYLGSTPSALRNTFDKIIFKQICQESQIRTAKFEKVDLKGFHDSFLTTKPFVLKPIRGGSNIDTFIVRKPLKNFSAIDKTIQKYGTMLLEELIEGKEITVGILGDQALPAVEIIPPEGEEFDFENKYNGRSQEICPPTSVSASLQKEAQELALKAHRAAGCRHFSRVDMIIKNTEIYVLELNSIPGMTKASLYPKEAKSVGLDIEDLIKELTEMAVKN